MLSVTYGRTIFFPQNISQPFFQLFSVTDAPRNAYKMTVSVKLPLN